MATCIVERRNSYALSAAERWVLRRRCSRQAASTRSLRHDSQSCNSQRLNVPAITMNLCKTHPNHRNDIYANSKSL